MGLLRHPGEGPFFLKGGAPKGLGPHWPPEKFFGPFLLGEVFGKSGGLKNMAPSLVPLLKKKPRAIVYGVGLIMESLNGPPSISQEGLLRAWKENMVHGPPLVGRIPIPVPGGLS